MTAAQYGRSPVLEPRKGGKFSSSERGMNLRQILALFIAQGIDQQIIHEPVNRPGVPTFLNDQKANRRAPVFSFQVSR